MENETMKNETTEKESSKPKKFTTVLFCIWVCIAFLLVQGVIGAVGVIPIIVQSFNEAAGDMAKYQEIYMQKITQGSALTMIQTIASIASTVVIFIWYMFGYVKKETTSADKEKLKKQLLTKESIGLLLVGSVAVYSLASLIGRVAGMLMPNMNGLFNMVMDIAIGGDKVLGLITALVLAPIGEEICVRGIVIRRARRVYGVVGCAVISALLFGFLHLNPIQGLYVIPMGLFWGYLAYKYNSVIPSIICHFLNNFFSTISGVIGFEKHIAVVLIVFVVSLVGSIMLIKKGQS